MTHTSTEQPEALRQAAWLRKWFGKDTERAAQELEALHARVQELEAQVQRAAEVERAAILERVKNRAVAGALLVKDFWSIVADRGPAAPGQRVPLTDAQLDVLALDGEGLPNSHLEFARAVERAHGITQEKQG